MKTLVLTTVLMLSVVLFSATSWASSAGLCSSIFTTDARVKFDTLTNEQILNTELWNLLKGEINADIKWVSKNTKPGSVPWTGLKEFSNLSIVQKDIAERFSAESFKFHNKRDRSVADIAIWTYVNLMQDVGAGKVKDVLRILPQLTKDARDKMNNPSADPKAVRQSLEKIVKALEYFNGNKSLEISSLKTTQIVEAKIRADIVNMLQSYYKLSDKDVSVINTKLLEYSELAQQQGIKMLVDHYKIDIRMTTSSLREYIEIVEVMPLSSLKRIFESTLVQVDLIQ